MLGRNQLVNTKFILRDLQLLQIGYCYYTRHVASQLPIETWQLTKSVTLKYCNRIRSVTLTYCNRIRCVTLMYCNKIRSVTLKYCNRIQSVTLKYCNRFKSVNIYIYTLYRIMFYRSFHRVTLKLNTII